VRIDYLFRVEHAPDPQVTERSQQLGAANRLGDLHIALSAWSWKPLLVATTVGEVLLAREALLKPAELPLT
jgi:hypothetical protein